MHWLARHHPARTPLFVLALVVAMGAAMCVRVHRAIAHPDAAAEARPVRAAGVTTTTGAASGARR